MSKFLEESRQSLKSRGLEDIDDIELIYQYGIRDDMYYLCLNTDSGLQHEYDQRYKCYYYNLREETVKAIMKKLKLDYKTHKAGKAASKFH